MVTAIALFWLSEYALGTETNRDAVAIGVVIVSLWNVFTYLPHAINRLKLGGARDSWRLLMGNVLFWAGVGSRESWLMVVRAAGRPEWMVNSPLNGFFAFWIVCAGFLCVSASSEATSEIPQHRLFYVFAALCAGLLIGVIATRLLG